MMKSKLFWFIVLLAIGGGLWYLGSGRGKPAEFTAYTMPMPESNYAAVAQGKVDVDGGVIEVAARLGGVYREILVEEGDMVEPGQVLAIQEDDEERIALKSAEASLESAKAQMQQLEVRRDIARRELERLEPLVEIDAASTLELDRARDDLRQVEVDIIAQNASMMQTEAQLESARFRLEQRTVRAPMAGRIIEAKARPGVGASTLNVSAAFTLMPDKQKIVRADLDESFVPAVSIGQMASIVPDADRSKSYEGEVIRKGEIFGRSSGQANTSGMQGNQHVIEVVVAAGDIPLLIGQRVTVRFLKEGKDDSS